MIISKLAPIPDSTSKEDIVQRMLEQAIVNANAQTRSPEQVQEVESSVGSMPRE